MAYNTMSVISQRPYVINNYNGFAKAKEDDASSESSRSSESQNEQPQINQNGRNKDIQQQLAESKIANQKAIESRDANLKNATVNISQIIKDFKGTVTAIGSSPELAEEVNTYLTLVEQQSKKENPDTRLIRSNLKNASSLLDNYITETLQRPSKVVENWIDALFLQQINYKFNDGEINPNFLVKFPNQKKEEDDENSSQNDNEQEESKEEKDSSNKAVIVPKDEKLKTLFLQAKKYVYANDAKKAMGLFKQALDRAIEVQDKETESKVLFEIGKIYDKHDYLAQALTSYSKSLSTTTDVNIKTKAHYSMAQIYDDVAQTEPAINHYMSSISYAGVNENLASQSTSLAKIGNIYSEKYQKKALDFLEEADVLSSQTNNHKVKGFVSSHLADSYDKFNEPQKALKYFSTAVLEYQEAKSPLKVAINYKRAAEVMQDFNNTQKAKSLYKKALVKARQTDDVELMKEIHAALSTI